MKSTILFALNLLTKNIKHDKIEFVLNNDFHLHRNFQSKVTIWKTFEEFGGDARKGRLEFLLVKIAASPRLIHYKKPSKFKHFLIDKIDRILFRILTTFHWVEYKNS